MSSVPIVDLTNPSATSLGALDAACRSHGFFLLAGHGLDELIARMWAQTERFFDAPASVREGLRRSETSPFGYNDRELTKRFRDCKQVFDFGDPSVERLEALNHWPAALDGFRDTMVEFHMQMGRLLGETMSLLHAALGLSDESRTIMRAEASGAAVRLNHYPVADPVAEPERAGLAALGPTALGYHTDPGSLTLLLQDETGGLQTRTRAGDWIDVEPEPGTIVVNLGDAVQVWTNDRYVAAVHRVVNMTDRRRFSIPFFANPPRQGMLEPLHELVDGAPRYRPFRWMDFAQARNTDNVHDVGAPDAQISDYAISVI